MNATPKHYTSGGSFFDKAVPSEQPLDLQTGKFCYVILESSKDENGYIPCLAIEGDESVYPMLGRGHCATPWYWGKTFSGASAIARKTNERMGITLEREFYIVKEAVKASLRKYSASRHSDAQTRRAGR